MERKGGKETKILENIESNKQRVLQKNERKRIKLIKIILFLKIKKKYKESDNERKFVLKSNLKGKVGGERRGKRIGSHKMTMMHQHPSSLPHRAGFFLDFI